MSPAERSVCECCEPVAAATPLEIYNRPALEAVGYRVGSFASFRQAMLQRLADEPALDALGTRRSDDYAITAIELFAAVGDVLTFHQERYANEAFLRTARFRDSVARLGALIDYRLRPGVAARALISFVLESGRAMEIAERQKIQSVPQSDERPQVFETLAPLAADARWNRLRVLPAPALRNPLGAGRLDARLAPAAAAALVRELAPGNRVVLFDDAGTAAIEEKEIARVEVEGDRARIVWTLPIASPTWSANTLVHRVRRSFRLFGHNAPPQFMTPSSSGGRIVWTLQTTASAIAAGDTLDLDGVVEGLAVGHRLLVSIAGAAKRRVVIQQIEQTSATVGATTGTVTRIRLTPAHDGGPRSAIVIHELEGAQVELAPDEFPETILGEEVSLPGVLVEDATLGRGVEIERRITRQGLVPGVALFLREIEPGRLLLLGDADPRHTIPATIRGAARIEPATASTDAPCRLVLPLAVDGVLALDPATAFLLGNVAEASHGETVVGETLGGGAAATEFQRFALAKKPLTFLPAATPEGTASTLAVWADGVRWQEVQRLYGSDADAAVYELRHADDGTTTVQFGDGAHGARLPTGFGNVRARYRFGSGLAGRVAAGTLTTLLQKPAGLDRASNPLPAEGGAEAEALADARINAPRTVRTFGRIVSLEDFEDLARASGEVAKARAAWTWDGLERTLHLTVAAQAGAPLSQAARAGVRASLDAVRASHVRLRVDDFVRVPIRVRAGIGIDPRFESAAVLRAAHEAVVEALSFAQQELGRALHSSDLYRVLQGVDGVVFVDLDLLHFKPPAALGFFGILAFLFWVLRRGATFRPVQDHLRIFGARPDPDNAGVIRPAELATLEAPELDVSIEQRSL